MVTRIRRRSLFVGMSTSVFGAGTNSTSGVGRETLNAYGVDISKSDVLRTQGISTAVAWSPDSKFLATSSNYGQLISVWSRDGHQVAAFERVGDGPFLGTSLCFADDSNHIFFRPPGGYGDSVALALWNVTIGKVVKTFEGPQPTADYGRNRADRFLYCKATGKVFIGKSISGPNMVIQSINHSTVDRIISVEGGVTALAYFKGGRSVIVGSWHGKYSLLDGMNGDLLKSSQAYERSEFGSITIDDVSGSPDGTILLTGIRNISITGKNIDLQKEKEWALNLDAARIFREDDGILLGSFNKPATVIRQSAWDPLGKYVLLIANQKSLLVWILSKKYKRIIEIDIDGDPYSVAISPDGCNIAVSTSSCVELFTVKQ